MQNIQARLYFGNGHGSAHPVGKGGLSTCGSLFATIAKHSRLLLPNRRQTARTPCS